MPEKQTKARSIQKSDRPANVSCLGDSLFDVTIVGISFTYLCFVALLVGAVFCSTSFVDIGSALASEPIRYAVVLSLASSTISALLSIWIATPIGYVMSRSLRSVTYSDSNARRWCFAIADAILDIPIALPPLVVGIGLLVLFRFPPFALVGDWVVYELPAVVIAQTVVASALAVRTMRTTFEQIDDRQERVAQTLGATKSQAFWFVLLPQARPGILAAGTTSWARSLGEFGPVLIFASATRMRTEVMPTTVYLEMQAGDLRSALAVSTIMVMTALAALVVTRLLGQQRTP